MENKLDKKEFYSQIKKYCNPFLKNKPININMKINDNSKYKIILDEYWITTDGSRGNDFILQIIDTTKDGYKKYLCSDIRFNIDEENIFSDFQMYKLINKKIQEVLGGTNGKSSNK